MWNMADTCTVPASLTFMQKHHVIDFIVLLCIKDSNLHNH